MNDQRPEDDALIVAQVQVYADELALEQYYDNQQGTLACLCFLALMVVGMIAQLFALGDTPRDHAAASGGDIQRVQVARVNWGAR